MTTRRAFVFAVAAAGSAAGAGLKFGEEMRQGDVGIILFDATEPVSPGGLSFPAFMVGVRAAIGEMALVEVFYKVTTSVGDDTTLIDVTLSEESTAPIAGDSGYGATRKNFHIRKENVTMVRVTLLKALTRREFKT